MNSFEEWLAHYWPDVVEEWQTLGEPLSLAEYTDLYYEDLSDRFHNPDDTDWVNSWPDDGEVE